MYCIYGPFLSRRIGLSLGIDLLAQFNLKKLCTYNCIYCEIGETPPFGYCSVDKRVFLENYFIKHLENRLSEVLKNEKSLDSITPGYSNIQSKNIKKLAEAYNLIKPDLIQLYSVSRHPAKKFAKKVYSSQLREAQNLVKQFLEDNNLKDKVRIF
ncbi:MAG: hypothetical protein EU549_00490 [Promethearchaeota archaeon]|nr:MAG: hypothetical protein EU549_00490 [Candidatus Lokiarchaeota archaeon]